MGKARTATKILELRGSYKAHPERRPKNEPEGAVFDSKPPKHLTRQESAVWRELIGYMPPGVLQLQDRFVLELCSCLLCEYRIQKSEYMAAKMNQLTRLLTELGLTPASRSKVIVPKDKEKGDGWENA